MDQPGDGRPHEPALATEGVAGAARPTGARRTRLSDTGRVEAFSDAVFAIVGTLLVLEVRPAPHPNGGLAHALLRGWPDYVAYLASFLYVGMSWFNHHEAFGQVRYAQRGLYAANILVLLTTALIPFPSAVLLDAFGRADSPDKRVAVLLYAGNAVLVAATWLGLFVYLDRHRHLLDETVGRGFFRYEMHRALSAMAAYAVAGLLGVATLPALALALFLLIPVGYWVGAIGHRPAPRRLRWRGRGRSVRYR